MADLSAGTVTFLFTDLEGSTRLLRQLRERYGDVLAEHQRLLRAAFEEAGGEEVDTQGDAFFVAFRTASDAVRAAVKAQRALVDHEWPDEIDVRARIGIHTGSARVVDRRYLGLAVHRAARISATAHGGQIVLSQATHALLEDEEEDVQGATFHDLGEHRLKDFDRPVRLYQVLAPGLPHDFPPLRTEESKETHELPFAGREGELADTAERSVSTRARRIHRRRVALGGAVLAATALAAVIGFLSMRDGGPAAPAVKPNSLVRIDPSTERIESVTAMGSSPGAVVYAANALWVLNEYDRTVTRVDAETESTSTVTSALDYPCCLATQGPDGVWISGYGTRELKHLNAITAQPDRVIRLDGLVHGSGDLAHAPRLQRLSAIGDGSLWLVDPYSNRVRRVGLRSGAEVADHRVATQPFGISYGSGSAWVSSYGGDAVTEIRSSDDVTTRMPVPGGPAISVAAGDAVWVNTWSDGKVRRVDKASGATTDIVETGKGAAGTLLADIVFGFGAIWVTFGEGAVVRIDADDPNDVSRIELGHRAGSIAIGPDAVWVTVQDPITTDS